MVRLSANTKCVQPVFVIRMVFAPPLADFSITTTGRQAGFETVAFTVFLSCRQL